MVTHEERIWVFNGDGEQFPGGVFSTRDKAEHWIYELTLSGTLTAYPVDISAYDWAVSSGFFKPKCDEQEAPKFIQRFSSAYMEHYHYENGVCVS